MFLLIEDISKYEFIPVPGLLLKVQGVHGNASTVKEEIFNWSEKVLMAKPHRFRPEGLNLIGRRRANIQEERGVVRVGSREISDRGLRIKMNPKVIGKVSI